jgi:hypothetical protein
MARRQRDPPHRGRARRACTSIGEDAQVTDHGEAATYQRRYTCPPLGDAHPCFSVGVRHPFAGHQSFVWVRFNRTTRSFALIHNRLSGSRFSDQLVESGATSGHRWMRPSIPTKRGWPNLYSSNSRVSYGWRTRRWRARRQSTSTRRRMNGDS